jgi:hypothetical protein
VIVVIFLEGKGAKIQVIAAVFLVVFLEGRKAKI